MKGKNKKGSGSYRILKNGTICFTVSVGYDESGKRIRKSFFGKTESECRKQHQKFIKEGEKPKEKTTEHTLTSWIDTWLTVYKQPKVEDSTLKDYNYIASHIKEHKIGDMKLTEVKPIDITAYFSSKIELSQSFRKRSKFLLNAAFETAIDNDLTDKNPVRRAEIAKKPETEKEAYTEAEAVAIVNFAKTDKHFGLIMYILLNSGIRAGEMRALSIDRINFDEGYITIDRSIKRSGEIGKPKNGKTRYIPLEEDATELLKERLQGKTGYVVGGKDYYTTHSGFRGRYECFFKRLNLFLEGKGENPIVMKSPHSTRHTFASERTKRGMPVAILMQIMGHSSREMTDHYTHVGDIETLTEAVRKYSTKK